MERLESGLSLEELIALTLANDPNIALADLRVDSARGGLLVEQGLFEPLLESDFSHLDARSPQAGGTVDESAVTDVSAGWSHLLPSGLSMDASVAVQRQEPEDGVGLETTTLSWTFRQPLLRDRGRRVVAAGLLAAEEELTAQTWDRVDEVARRIVAAVSQYWQVVAADQDLRILRISEESSRTLLANTQRLIEADLLPAADRVLVEADLLAKETATLSAETALYAARQDLELVTGTLQAGGAGLPLPVGEFSDLRLPAGIGGESGPAGGGGAEDVIGVSRVVASAESWVARAMTTRPEIQAAELRLEAGSLREEAARNGLLPRVDLLLTPGYETLSLDTAGFAPVPDLDGEASGFSATLGIGLSWPWLRRAARGRLIQSTSARRQQALQLDLVRDDVIAGVRKALDAVDRSAVQVAKAARGVALFEQAVSNEEKKLKAGSSTLIDVIGQRDRLTSIRRQEIQARFALALAVLDLRFQTGTLVEVRQNVAEEATLRVPVQAVLTLPENQESVLAGASSP
ncbi:MAG: TolC family protein [Acidobacteriota bacterium]|nr:TolC family protein [Acidobacteriota bacterium]